MTTTTSNNTASVASATQLADATPSSRNRAVDAYRAGAMVAVAIGHWLVTSVVALPDGSLDGKNGLGSLPELHWLTWIFQVMPLFFIVGGFATSISLDAHVRDGGRSQDWIAARLRRMLAPTVVLAATWLTFVVIGSALGAGGVLVAGATAAAIPLWFLSNYTVDTAVAPALLPRFRARPLAVSCMLGGSFLLIEATRYLGVPYLPYLNWVTGWLIFQVVGFAWRDGFLPTGRSMAVTAAGLWCALVAMITIGPWPVTMVHYPGLQFSPTGPPSIALLTFGLAYGATAIAAAPALNRWLQSNKRAWTVVVGASGVAMSVYLWHMTAALGSVLLLDAVGMIPETTTGSTAWWIAKVPFTLLATLILVGIVSVVAPTERKALLAPRSSWHGGMWSIGLTAAAVSISIKFWSLGSALGIVLGTAALLSIWFAFFARQSEPTTLKA